MTRACIPVAAIRGPWASSGEAATIRTAAPTNAAEKMRGQAFHGFLQCTPFIGPRGRPPIRLWGGR